MAGDRTKPLPAEDLTFFTDEDLFKEIESRFDSFVWMGSRYRPGENEDDRHYQNKGDPERCLGIATRLIHLLNLALDEEAEHEEEEE